MHILGGNENAHIKRPAAIPTLSDDQEEYLSPKNGPYLDKPGI